MAWVLVQQLAKHRGEEYLTDIKTIQFFPIFDKDTGERVKFGRLQNPIRQVCINLKSFVDDPDNPPIRIRQTPSGFSVNWPDKKELVTIKVRGINVPDKLNPRYKTVKGPLEQLPNLKMLKDFLTGRFGADIAEQVCNLFT